MKWPRQRRLGTREQDPEKAWERFHSSAEDEMVSGWVLRNENVLNTLCKFLSF